jgi:RNA polymerase sigma factor (TIGR02999 family)
MNTVDEREFDQVYAELRMLARRALHSERSDHSWSPSTLVHRAWLKLKSLPLPTTEHEREPYIRKASWEMRCLLIDHARRKKAHKRDGGERISMDLVDGHGKYVPVPDFGLLHEVLEQLADEKPQWATALNLTYFYGMTQEEVSIELDRSIPTVQRYLDDGKCWLKTRLEKEGMEGEA